MRYPARVVRVTGLWLAVLAASPAAPAEVKAWEGTLTLPTYPWEEDANPQFWALQPENRSSIVYPYTMQDYLWRKKEDRTYKALFLENEYLKVTCLPQLGGRIHSVLDKSTGQEMFHLNGVIKPSMIAMRGAWISGGIEWNAGPQGHTVTCVSPVDALIGREGESAYLEISNLEKTQRTRWTVRLTLHPGKAYLDERIRLFNPNDALSPYYFWNCTAYPNRPGTRFIFPMSLGTDHSGEVFFNWPIHEGRDLTWLKNHETWASIFAHRCIYDFFGAYDVDADRGIVQSADHRALGGKKAWTWGQWEFGQVSQKNLTDEDGPYIEVQSGPLPTQLDYGPLWPRQQVEWREFWYLVHGLGDGFEFATRDVAIQTRRRDGKLELRLLATGVFEGARCVVSKGGATVADQPVRLAPDKVASVEAADVGDAPVRISIHAKAGDVLATFESPLPIPAESPPEPPAWAKKPDDQLTAEEAYLKARKFDLASDRGKARASYEKALALDAGHAAALRDLAVLDIEAARWEPAAAGLRRALASKPDDGVAAYFLGLCELQGGAAADALESARRAAGAEATAALGHDLAGRAYLALKKPAEAVAAFGGAVRANAADARAADHLLIARYAAKSPDVWQDAERAIARRPTDLIPRAVLSLRSDDDRRKFADDVRSFVGEIEFELLDAAWVFARLGLEAEAVRVLDGVCGVDAAPATRGATALYHLAYWSSRAGDAQREEKYLDAATGARRRGEFSSTPDAARVLEYVVGRRPSDAAALVDLGNVRAHLGDVAGAAASWAQAVERDPAQSVAWRNLGLHARVTEKDAARAVECYQKAIAARPDDQTLYRDAAECLIEAGRRPEAIALLEAMRLEKPRRADVTILLARSYADEKRFDDALALLESTAYFVAWEGQTTPWDLFSGAHILRGQKHFEAGEFAAALVDFDAALTYPSNLGVGRSNKPPHARGLYWRGKALEALGRGAEARRAWREGAESFELAAGAAGADVQHEYRLLCAERLGQGR
ncbi:MAG: Beta-barrel assembly-enhancing protease [Phycisphaerae bacterium]|nr:Beta-barrel assembly-enhancing protease [Phycisphaerae bacterium]